MVEGSGIPVVGGMTVIALVTALDMIGRFTIRRLVIVTTVTGADDRKVVDACYRTPCARRMTIVAGVGALNVIARFAAGLATIVTGGTGAGGDIAVIESG